MKNQRNVYIKFHIPPTTSRSKTHTKQRHKINTCEPSHEVIVIFVLRKLILQTHIGSHLVELHVWFLVGPFAYFHTWCVRTAKALARLQECTGSPEPSLVAYVISTITSWAGSTTSSFVEPGEQFFPCKGATEVISNEPTWISRANIR